jgi:aminoglycoside phosphotransferase family enzyme
MLNTQDDSILAIFERRITEGYDRECHIGKSTDVVLLEKGSLALASVRRG